MRGLFMIIAVIGLCIGGTAFLMLPSDFATVLGALSIMLIVISGLGTILFKRAEPQDSLEAIPAILAHDTDSIVITNATGDVGFLNIAAQERFGTSEHAGIGQMLSTMLANPDPLIARLITRANADGSAKEDVVTRSTQFRLSIVRSNAQHYLWRIDESNNGGRFAARGSDSLTLPMLTAGQSGAVLFANDAFRKLVGHRPRNLSEVFTDLPLRSGQIHQVQAEIGTINCIIAEIPGSTGRREIYVIPDDDQNAFGGPRELDTDWDAIENLPVPLLKIASNGDLLAANREARGLLDMATIAGKTVSDILDGLGRPMVDWLREASEGRGGHVSQFLRGRGRSQDKFVQVTLNIARGAEEPHLIAVLSDVTELKTLEAQFVQSQKMHAIGQLAGGVAHDFNNLLTAISGHCDLLLLRHDQGDQDYGDLIQIHQNSNRAASLVGQLLAFSRKQNLQPEIVDMRETLSELTHLLNRLVGEKVQLSLQHDPDLSPIMADKRQLEQVIMNLVVNARDAMPSGGEIRVTTENMHLDEAWEFDRALVPAGSYVVVKVLDEGIGTPPEKLPKIFEPFVTTKRVGEGTGLGLSTAHGIVKQSGGYIFAESEVGVGTLFTLLFPSHDLPIAEPVVPVSPTQPPEIHSDGGVVLLVEDEAPVRAFASRALRLRGFTVLEADCAEMALSLLEDPELAVDIFVTDVIMPGMDGPTWVREALTDRPSTKVVFVSGYAEDAFVDEKSKIPNAVFLPKPFSLNDLTNTVSNQLQ